MALFQYTRKTFAREFLLLGLGLLFCVPAFVLVVLSLKTTQDTYTTPFSIPSPPQFDNYSQAWSGGSQGGLDQAMQTSVIITVSSVVLLILVGSLCSYALARRESRLSNGLYILFMLGIIFPYQLAIVPIYVVMRDLHLANVPGMVVLYTGLLMPFTVFLYTGFIRALPKDYEEAAQVDGAGLFRTWLRVVFPLLMPVTGTVAVLTGLIVWNDFFLPLIFLSGEGQQTLPLALYSFVGEQVSQWNLVMAAVAITIAPVIAFYLFAQRQLIRGFAGGIRG